MFNTASKRAAREAKAAQDTLNRAIAQDEFEAYMDSYDSEWENLGRPVTVSVRAHSDNDMTVVVAVRGL